MRTLLNSTCILLLPQKHIKNKGYLLPDSQLTVDCDMSKLSCVVPENIHNTPPSPTPMEGTFTLDHPHPYNFHSRGACHTPHTTEFSVI